MKFTNVRHSINYDITNTGTSWYCKTGHSKYYERLDLQHAGKLPEGEKVYGFEQALEHVEEFALEHPNDKKCWIVKTSSITEDIIIK